MAKKNERIAELIREIDMCSPDELNRLRELWIKELIRAGAPIKAITLCANIVDYVIKTKEKRA